MTLSGTSSKHGKEPARWRATACAAACLAGLVWATPASAARPNQPLVAGPGTHVVVMEYEAWFGPDAVTFQNAEALPLLHSADMDQVGGGYDSRDPAVIRQHVAWIESAGADAVTLDLTNNISCIFDSDAFVAKYLQDFNGCTTYRRDYQNIRDNVGNLYPAWTRLGTKLKIIPLLGAIDQNAFIVDQDGKTAFEKEIDYFDGLVARYPGRSVVYDGKPLLLLYLGAPVNPGGWPDQLRTIRRLLDAHPLIASGFTLRMVSGFLESQPAFWAASQAPATGAIQIDPQYGFWSLVDRLKPDHHDFPTYSRHDGRVENLAISTATPGQDGWGCPEPYPCADDALRYGPHGKYGTLDSFMPYARTLRPTFLFINQFNEFDRGNGDEGWDADTSDDIEPSRLWGYGPLEAVREKIRGYRAAIQQAP